MNLVGCPGRGLLILMYHGIGRPRFSEPAIMVSEENFERQLGYLLRRYRVLSLEDGVELLERGLEPPRNNVVLTFDDGYRDNYEKAFPLLKKYGCPATIFVATEPLATGHALWPNRLYFWCAATKASELRLRPDDSTDDTRVFQLQTARRRRRAFYAMKSLLINLDRVRRDALLKKIAAGLGFDADSDPFNGALMLTWDQIKEMADAGIGIGSHTLTHPVLSTLRPDDAARELTQSKEILERKLNRPITLFAYPFGGRKHFNPAIEVLTQRAGYRAACSTIRGANRPGVNRFALLRTYVRDEPTPIFALRLLWASLQRSPVPGE